MTHTWTEILCGVHTFTKAHTHIHKMKKSPKNEITSLT